MDKAGRSEFEEEGRSCVGRNVSQIDVDQDDTAPSDHTYHCVPFEHECERFSCLTDLVQHWWSCTMIEAQEIRLDESDRISKHRPI